MIPSQQKRRGDPDAFGSLAPVASARKPAAPSRYRLLLTRLPGRWELIIFDRELTGVMRRLEGPVVEALVQNGMLPETLRAEGACEADKAMVRRLFLASAGAACSLESGGDAAQEQAPQLGPRRPPPTARVSRFSASP